MADLRKLQEKTRKNAEKFVKERRERDNLPRTADSDDPLLGWTAQQGAAPQQSRTRDYVRYRKEELPDPEVARAAGTSPQYIPEKFIAKDSGEEATVFGPEPRDSKEYEKVRKASRKLTETSTGATVSGVEDPPEPEKGGGSKK